MKHKLLYMTCLLFVIGSWGCSLQTKTKPLANEEDTQVVKGDETNWFDEIVQYIRYTQVVVGEDTLLLENPVYFAASPCPTTLYLRTRGESTVTKLGFTLWHRGGNKFVISCDDYECSWTPPDEEWGMPGYFSGHCYYEYPCWYENGEFHEYGTEDITMAEFVKMDGAHELLDSLSSEGCKVTEMFTRQDGHTFINLRRDIDTGCFFQAYVDFPYDRQLQDGIYRRSVLRIVGQGTSPDTTW